MSTARYRGGPTNGAVKCPRCGSGKTYEELLPHPNGSYLMRYVCTEFECRHTWADQIDEWPTTRDRRD